MKRTLPEGILWRLRSARFPWTSLVGYAYDARTFMKWAARSEQPSDRQQLRARLMLDAHKIEKALSLPSPRILFGREVIRRLVRNLDQYRAQYPWDSFSLMAYDNLVAYYEFNRAGGATDDQLGAAIEAMRATIPDRVGAEAVGGTVTLSRDEVLQVSQTDLMPFLKARHSVRHFDPRPVDISLIYQAAEMAQTTPSVCNRQSSRVHVYTSRDTIRRILEIQAGSRGFDHVIDKLLVVTSDRREFVHGGERNQCWVDGGMYAMSLVYALHSLGLGTCCLNWSATREQDKRLRAAVDIPPWEGVLMLIAVGHLPEEFRVARSTRKPASEVVFVEQAAANAPSAEDGATPLPSGHTPPA